MSLTILEGHVLDRLRGMEAGSVQVCVTSPPYWSLRDYSTAPQAWGGAWMGHLGLEPTPELYIQHIVEIFREVRRILRKDGTLWLNLGDCYAANRGYQVKDNKHTEVGNNMGSTVPLGLKPKDLVGIPWSVAFALRADGWTLRQEIIWEKPNPMPESVRDRCTRSHEQMFMFSKARWIGAGDPPVWLCDKDAAWLAALVDGEGTICFQDRTENDNATTYSIRLSIVNTHRGLLERIAALCNVGGGPGSPSPRLRNDGNAGRPIYCWQVTTAKAAKVIAAIRPYLIAKAVQADLALSVHILNQKHKGRGGHTTTDEDAMFKTKAASACSELNHGKNPDLSWFTPLPWGRWTSQPYIYDAKAIAEPVAESSIARISQSTFDTQTGG